jgi:predicted nucleic acid-binding protein
LVIDANIAIKWFVDEAGSEIARQILAVPGKLLAPGHALGEIGHALVRYRRSQHVTADQYEEIKAMLPPLLEFVPIDGIFAPALDIAWDTGISVYDALYVALAVRRGVLLITADMRLLRSLAASAWHGLAIGLDDWSVRAAAAP